MPNKQTDISIFGLRIGNDVQLVKFHKIISPLFLSLNSVFIILAGAGILDKAPKWLRVTLIFFQILLMSAYLFYLYLYNQATKGKTSEELLAMKGEDFYGKILNQNTMPFLVFATVLAFTALMFSIQKLYGKQLDIAQIIIVIAALYVVVFFILDLVMRAQSRILDDELRIIKTKDAGFYSYHYSMALLLIFTGFYLFSDGFKTAIIPFFHGNEAIALLSCALLCTLAGGIFGRVTIWLKYR